ncbi:MAG: hypothetical protein JRE57_04670 [Deltaproteobacteria bacterium]|nr:hypothetical protein [Deltaproteobacteria bacterium]
MFRKGIRLLMLAGLMVPLIGTVAAAQSVSDDIGTDGLKLRGDGSIDDTQPGDVGGDVDREDRAEREDRADREDRAERGDRAERPERAERPDRAERPERAERPDRPERTDRSG